MYIERKGAALHMVALTTQGISFNEEGYVLSVPAGISQREIRDAVKEVALLIPAIRRERIGFRETLRNERIRAMGDPMVPKPSPRHGGFWQNGEPVRRVEVPRLEAMGYSTASCWNPMCIQDGAATHSWLLWPPEVAPEETFLFKKVSSLYEVIEGVKGWTIDTTKMVSMSTPDGETYSGTIKFVSPSGTATASTYANVLVVKK